MSLMCHTQAYETYVMWVNAASCDIKYMHTCMCHVICDLMLLCVICDVTPLCDIYIFICVYVPWHIYNVYGLCHFF